ncbi:hypothetical protein AMK16_26020 [Streptomyces sp. CB00455]|nr:hypothetical protein AMK16_26020 [Streptomyces sp. CB00455]
MSRPVTAATTAAFNVTVLLLPLLLLDLGGRVAAPPDAGTPVMLGCIVLFLHACVVVAGVAPDGRPFVNGVRMTDAGSRARQWWSRATAGGWCPWRRRGRWLTENPENPRAAKGLDR